MKQMDANPLMKNTTVRVTVLETFEYTKEILVILREQKVKKRKLYMNMMLLKS